MEAINLKAKLEKNFQAKFLFFAISEPLFFYVGESGQTISLLNLV